MKVAESLASERGQKVVPTLEFHKFKLFIKQRCPGERLIAFDFWFLSLLLLTGLENYWRWFNDWLER